MSFNRSASHSSGRNSPSDDPYVIEDPPSRNDYDDLLGYSSEFLAGLLCPHRSSCHQKFELLVDDLAFVGHPVSAEADGVWRFKPDRVKASSRGRESRNRLSQPDGFASASPDKTSTPENPESVLSSWLQTFHFVIVLDLPDPSSSASGNVSKYFDILYEQIAFTVTAVLFQEQVLSNFVEAECDVLGSLKDAYIARGSSLINSNLMLFLTAIYALGEPFPNFMTQALQISSIAPAMKSLYEAIKTSSMAYITIHHLPLELQLPPYLDVLLHSEEDNEGDFVNPEDDYWVWGPEMSLGWRLPSLAPWKSLLLLDGSHELDPHMNLRGPHVSPEDRSLAEGLIKFLETASVTLSCVLTNVFTYLQTEGLHSILRADLPMWLVSWTGIWIRKYFRPSGGWYITEERKWWIPFIGASKLYLLSHRNLTCRTCVIILSEQLLDRTFPLRLLKLIADFEQDFSGTSAPCLPHILSTMSTSTSKQSDNHFFAAVVRSKDLVPLYHDVVLWMLKRDMLITLHLRIRVVATQEVKTRVRVARERAQARRLRKEGHKGGKFRSGQEIPEAKESWLSLSPMSAQRYQRLSSPDAEASKMNNSAIDEDEKSQDQDAEDSEEDDNEEDGGDVVGWDTREDYLWPSMIYDPGRATPLQRRWLSAMSEGKDEFIARRFEQWVMTAFSLINELIPLQTG
jgi:hypothetical protein